jgi:hypothetical protein
VEAHIMSTDVLERTGTSEALSDFRWQPRRAQQFPPRGFGFYTDVTSVARVEAMPFGQHALVFEQPIPRWSHGLLMKISELGELEAGWDSYGARPVDPRCAVATAEFVLNLLDRNMPQPTVVATTRGGIQLEWRRAGADLEIEIESPARFHVFFEDEQTGEEKELTLSNNLLPLLPLLERLNAAD